MVSIVIALATVILVYGAYGYGINTKTGQIIENGLLFVDSKPGGADIYLNSKPQPNKTAARLVLTAGAYKLTLSKDGYRSWQRSFVLNEHSIDRYVYPFLFPQKPQITELKNYSSLPTLATQSPDRHWLLAQTPSSVVNGIAFDEYDTSNLAAGSQTLVLPSDLLSGAADAASSLKEVEWSTDNKHLLLEHTFASGHEFVVFDRSDPSKSFNVNKLFKVDPSRVVLRNKKIDQLYIYNQADASLQVADTGQGVLAPVFLKRVLDFKPYGNTLLTYVTDVGMQSGKVQARIWDDGKTYPLYTFSAGNKYLIDAAQFQGHWYYVAGSDTAARINIFKDPLSDIKSPSIARAVPSLGFSMPGATAINFSDNTRFIGVQAGQDAAVYDIETLTPYQYTVKSPLSSPLHWMDGHRWITQSGSDVFVVDYDNTNPQMVTPTVYPEGGFFSQDYNQLITFAQNVPAGGITLQRVDMRAGVDLPKNGAQ
ncbi:MAG: hypothetical protein JWO96_312 [Candidatus Saccharibacteria bacterium]|nr:hypothetical protein [Candidatus Saccharibacteria bacterium]